jgi:DNA-damage-inducible protein J
MSKTETVRARIEPRLKRDAETVLKKVGLTSSEAITLFYKQIELMQGLPFPVGVPNRMTQRAIADARARKGVEIFDSAEAWAKKARSTR